MNRPNGARHAYRLAFERRPFPAGTGLSTEKAFSERYRHTEQDSNSIGRRHCADSVRVAARIASSEIRCALEKRLKSGSLKTKTLLSTSSKSKL